MLNNLTKWVKGEKMEKREIVEESAIDSVAIEKASPNNIIVNSGPRNIVKIKPKEVVVYGKKCLVDPYQLMALIRNLTQSIGEQKSLNNVSSLYVIYGLRKARQDAIATLTEHFRIHWEADHNGNSNFYI